jgi:hypothetical protein
MEDERTRAFAVLKRVDFECHFLLENNEGRNWAVLAAADYRILLMPAPVSILPKSLPTAKRKKKE